MTVDLARNGATEITFVGEDVVSEQIPPPAASASSRKLAAECAKSSSDDNMIDPKGEIPEGYRLISLESLK